MLDKKQIKRLKEEAHFLKPVMNIGKDGLTESFKASLMGAFNTKELLKIKNLDNSPETKPELKEKLADIKGVELVQNIGHTYVLYKPREK